MFKSSKILRPRARGYRAHLHMKYVTTLSHDDFVKVMNVLRQAKEHNIIDWSATALVCENTKIELGK